VIQHRLSGSTTIRAGARPKNLIGGGLPDLGPGGLIEHPEQAPGVRAGLEGRPPQGRHARDRLRPGHDSQESPGHAQADALGLGDGGELILLIGGDLDGVLESLLKGLDLGLAAVELLLEFVDAGLGVGAVDGGGDLLGLAVERLSRLITVTGHLGDIAVSSAEDREGAGDTLRDRGHGDSLRRGRSRDHAHDCTRLDANCPRITFGRRPF
jgi:hypothetical protein